MRIQPITTNYYTKSNYAKIQQKKPIIPNFGVKINNHEYSERIVKLAKEYLDVPNWESMVRGNRGDYKHLVSNWQHDLADEGATGMRILAGILSFGATEVIMAGVTAVEAVVGGVIADNEIEEVRKCMNDLRKV